MPLYFDDLVSEKAGGVWNWEMFLRKDFSKTWLSDINWPVQTKSSYDNQDYVDVIDIEDEDHSFAAFFIGMKTGPSPYVKRPLVCSSCFTIFFIKVQIFWEGQKKNLKKMSQSFWSYSVTSKLFGHLRILELYFQLFIAHRPAKTM